MPEAPRQRPPVAHGARLRLIPRRLARGAGAVSPRYIRNFPSWKHRFVIPSLVFSYHRAASTQEQGLYPHATSAIFPLDNTVSLFLAWYSRTIALRAQWIFILHLRQFCWPWLVPASSRHHLLPSTRPAFYPSNLCVPYTQINRRIETSGGPYFSKAKSLKLLGAVLLFLNLSPSVTKALYDIQSRLPLP